MFCFLLRLLLSPRILLLACLALFPPGLRAAQEPKNQKKERYEMMVAHGHFATLLSSFHHVVEKTSKENPQRDDEEDWAWHHRSLCEKGMLYDKLAKKKEYKKFEAWTKKKMPELTKHNRVNGKNLGLLVAFLRMEGGGVPGCSDAVHFYDQAFANVSHSHPRRRNSVQRVDQKNLHARKLDEVRDLLKNKSFDENLHGLKLSLLLHKFPLWPCVAPLLHEQTVFYLLRWIQTQNNGPLLLESFQQAHEDVPQKANELGIFLDTLKIIVMEVPDSPPKDDPPSEEDNAGWVADYNELFQHIDQRHGLECIPKVRFVPEDGVDVNFARLCDVHMCQADRLKRELSKVLARVAPDLGGLQEDERIRLLKDAGHQDYYAMAKRSLRNTFQKEAVDALLTQTSTLGGPSDDAVCDNSASDQLALRANRMVKEYSIGSIQDFVDDLDLSSLSELTCMLQNAWLRLRMPNDEDDQSSITDFLTTTMDTLRTDEQEIRWYTLHQHLAPSWSPSSSDDNQSVLSSLNDSDNEPMVLNEKSKVLIDFPKKEIEPRQKQYQGDEDDSGDKDMVTCSFNLCITSKKTYVAERKNPVKKEEPKIFRQLDVQSSDNVKKRDSSIYQRLDGRSLAMTYTFVCMVLFVVAYWYDAVQGVLFAKVGSNAKRGRAMIRVRKERCGESGATDPC